MTGTEGLDVRDLGGVRVLALHGELDAVSAPPLAAELPHQLAGTRGVVLDLSDVTFFDSSGLRLVDEVARTCRRTGAPWRVVCPAGTPPRRVLEIVGMCGPEVVDDLETACRQLSG